jgi:hypothetical protein
MEMSIKKYGLLTIFCMAIATITLAQPKKIVVVWNGYTVSDTIIKDEANKLNNVFHEQLKRCDEANKYLKIFNNVFNLTPTSDYKLSGSIDGHEIVTKLYYHFSDSTENNICSRCDAYSMTTLKDIVTRHAQEICGCLLDDAGIDTAKNNLPDIVNRNAADEKIAIIYRGAVKDEITQNPIAGAKLSFQGFTDEVLPEFTDGEGTFIIELSKKYSNVRIRITKDGYESKEWNRNLLERNFEKPDFFYLTPAKPIKGPGEQPNNNKYRYLPLGFKQFETGGTGNKIRGGIYAVTQVGGLAGSIVCAIKWNEAYKSDPYIVENNNNEAQYIADRKKYKAGFIGSLCLLGISYALNVLDNCFWAKSDSKQNKHALYINPQYDGICLIYKF